MSFLEIQSINKKFGNHTALNDISFSAEKGELVSILGPSGCGKTTLLRILAGLESCDSGKVVIDGKDCTKLPPAARNFGIVFQSYALFPNMTVEQNIRFGLKQKKEMTRDSREGRIDEVLEMVDLKIHRKKFPHQLSGGQQQRTALARAIALYPDFLLLDEPLSALDAKVRGRLRGEIRDIQRQLGITTILVTHDQEEALTMSDRIIVMNNSVIEQTGAPKAIYHSPQTPFVADFIGSMNFYDYGSNVIGVRPEDIKVSATVPGADTVKWLGNLEKTEFRGPLTRIYGRLATGNQVLVDLPSDQVEKLESAKKEKLFFYVEQSRVLEYNEERSRAI